MALRNNAVVVEGVSVSYETSPGQMVRALNSVSLTVEAGKWTAVVGPSGSGKSTLLHVIGGLQSPTSGTVIVCDTNLERLNRAKLARFRLNRIGFVFQAFHLLPHLQAWENVALPLIAAGVAAAERRARALELLAQVGLADRVHHRPGELSGGEQQRVALARALANEPKVVIADEPTGNLDAASAQAVLDLLTHLVARKTAVVCATHDISVGERADNVVHIMHGQLDLSKPENRGS